MDDLERLDEVRHCRRCDVPYREINNLGVWGCKYHPGRVNCVVNDGTLGTWTCCAARAAQNPRRAHDNGCVACDHVWEITGTDNEPRLLLDAHTARITLGIERLAGKRGVGSLPHAHAYVVRRSADDDEPLPAEYA